MKRVVRPAGVLLFLLAALALAGGCGGGQGASAQKDGEAPDPLVMGIIPSEDNAAQIRAF